MVIKEVLNSKDVALFHRVPQYIYAQDSNWIPHLRQDIEKVFDKSNKAFRGGGKIRRWLLLNDAGIAIGRIAAFIHPKYSKGMEQPTGGIGFFECIEDKELAFKLFDIACSWLKEEGMEAADGPINFGEKDRFWGLLIENFEAIPSYAVNYNLPYYQKLFEEYGFQIYYNQHIYWRDVKEPPQAVFERKYEEIRNNRDYIMTDAVGKRWEEIASDFRTVYNNAWGGHHGFKPMSEEQSLKIIQSMKPIIDREIIFFMYHRNIPIGFYVNIPELNEIFKYVNGNLNWLGKMKFLYYKWRKVSRIMVGVVFGIDRSYHGKGVEAALIMQASKSLIERDRYDTTTMNWVGDFNPKMMKVVENLGSKRYRRLATYRKMLNPEIPFKRMPIVQ